MTTDWLDVLKLLLTFATDTCAVYVSIIPYIICVARLGGLQKTRCLLRIKQTWDPNSTSILDPYVNNNMSTMT